MLGALVIPKCIAISREPQTVFWSRNRYSNSYTNVEVTQKCSSLIYNSHCDSGLAKWCGCQLALSLPSTETRHTHTHTHSPSAFAFSISPQSMVFHSKNNPFAVHAMCVHTFIGDSSLEKTCCAAQSYRASLYGMRWQRIEYFHLFFKVCAHDTTSHSMWPISEIVWLCHTHGARWERRLRTGFFENSYSVN